MYRKWELRELVSVFLIQMAQLADTLQDNLPPLLELPVTLVGGTASTHSTTEVEEETNQISAANEHMQRYGSCNVIYIQKL